jgi:hypothetical protein
MRKKPPKSGGASPFEAARKAAQRATLKALRRARLAASRSGVDLSDWEGEFLGSVEERVRTYGRAFADPDKGAPGTVLSMMQGRKLKEITAKAKGEKPRARFGRKRDKPER